MFKTIKKEGVHLKTVTLQASTPNSAETNDCEEFDNINKETLPQNHSAQTKAVCESDKTLTKTHKKVCRTTMCSTDMHLAES